MASIINTIKNLDIYGGNYTFKYKGKEKYKTLTGGFISVASVLIIAFTTFVFTTNYFDTTKPEISTSTKILARFPKRDLYKQRYGIATGIYMLPSTVIPIANLSRYVTPLAYILEMNIQNVATGQLTFDAVEIIFFKACTEIEDKRLTSLFLESGSEEIQSFTKNYLVCPDIKNPEQFYVESNAYSPPYRIIQMMMYPCSLPDPTNCASVLELTNSNMNFAFLQTSFSPEKKENPLDYVPIVKDFRIAVSQQTRWDVTLKLTEIHDDNYDLSDTKKTFSFIEKDEEMMYGITRPGSPTHCTFEQMTAFICPAYSTLTIKSSGKLTRIVRTYPKLLGTLGEIGGTADIFVIVIGFLYAFYNSYFLQKFKEQRVLNHNVKELEKMYNEKDGENKEKIGQIAEKVVKEREDIIRLYGNQTGWEVLQGAFFQDFHKELFPIILLHSKRNKEIKMGRSYSRSQTQYKKTSVKTLKEAYVELLSFVPQNEVDRVIKEYFLKNVPEGLKNLAPVFAKEELSVDDFNLEDEIGKDKAVKKNQVGVMRNNAVGTSAKKDSWEIMGEEERKPVNRTAKKGGVGKTKVLLKKRNQN